MIDFLHYRQFAQAIAPAVKNGEVRFWATVPRHGLPFGRTCTLPRLVSLGMLASTIHVPAYGFRTTSTGTLSLAFLVAGSGHKRVDGEACRQRAGQLLITRPHETVNFTCDERFLHPGTGVWLVLDVAASGNGRKSDTAWHWPTWIRMPVNDLRRLETALRRPSCPRILEAPAHLQAMFLGIRELARRDPAGPIDDRAANLVTGILFALLDALTAPKLVTQKPEPPASRRFVAVTDSIERRFMQPIKVSLLAREADMNVPAFITAFKERFGQTPRQYIIQLRVKDAVRLMRTENLTVAEIAHKVGFRSPARLYALMLRLHACTPATFREN